jgi:hypothetical protein
VVRFSIAFVQERIPNRSRKRNVDHSADVDMPDFCRPEPEFPTSKTMRVNGHFRPQDYFLFQLFNDCHFELH